jgi:hypothetical protein
MKKEKDMKRKQKALNCNDAPYVIDSTRGKTVKSEGERRNGEI